MEIIIVKDCKISTKKISEDLFTNFVRAQSHEFCFLIYEKTNNFPIKKINLIYMSIKTRHTPTTVVEKNINKMVKDFLLGVPKEYLEEALMWDNFHYVEEQDYNESIERYVSINKALYRADARVYYPERIRRKVQAYWILKNPLKVREFIK